MPNWVRNVVEIKTNIEDDVRNKEVLNKIEDFYIKKEGDDGDDIYIDLTKMLDTSCVLDIGINTNILHNAKYIAAKLMDKYKMSLRDIVKLFNTQGAESYEDVLTFDKNGLFHKAIREIGYLNFDKIMTDFIKKNIGDNCIEGTDIKVKDLVFKVKNGDDDYEEICVSNSHMFYKIISERTWDTFTVDKGVVSSKSDTIAFKDILDEIIYFFNLSDTVALSQEYFHIDIPKNLIVEDDYSELPEIYDWYSFNLANIGTKWSLSRCDYLTAEDDRYIAIAFETAWTEPNGWFNHMCNKLIPSVLNGEEVVTVNMISQEEQITDIELYSVTIKSSGAELASYTESYLQHRDSLKDFLESNGLEEYIGDFYNRWDLAVEWAIDEGYLPENHETMSASEINAYVDEKMKEVKK